MSNTEEVYEDASHGPSGMGQSPMNGPSGLQEESTPIMSDKVQHLANSLYQEFESMISRYGEEVVENLMPIAVGMLESMNQMYQTKNDVEIELELLKEDSDQLLRQYEKEKANRKVAEERMIALEDSYLAEKRTLEEKIANSANEARLLDIRIKTYQDMIARSDEKEVEIRKEYQRLNERYRDLLRTTMERARYHTEQSHASSAAPANNAGGFVATGQRNQVVVLRPPPPTDMPQLVIPPPSHFSPGRGTTQTPTTPDYDPQGRLYTSFMGSDMVSSGTGTGEVLADIMNTSSASQAGGGDIGFGHTRRDASLHSQNMMNMSITLSPEDLARLRNFKPVESGDMSSSSQLYTKKLNLMAEIMRTVEPTMVEPDDDYESIMGPAAGPSIFEELRDAKDITEPSGEDEAVEDGNLSDEDGISREIDNLLKENAELNETKNALNIVKTDLINKLDDITYQKEILQGENAHLQQCQEALQERVLMMSAQLTTLKQQLQQAQNRREDAEDAEADVPLAQRKRFTRTEMARVLMERNQYKERLMELQEAVRWTEMLRASKEHPELVPKKKTSIWNTFANLFSKQPRKEANSTGTPSTPSHTSGTSSTLGGGGSGSSGSPRVQYRASTSPRAHAASLVTHDNVEIDIGSGMYSSVQVLPRHRVPFASATPGGIPRPSLLQADPNRMRLPGWTLSSRVSADKMSLPLSLPYPQYCRPLQEEQSGMKIWCASDVILSRSVSPSGANVLGGSIFYNSITGGNPSPSESSVSSDSTVASNSMVWICTTTCNQSQVIIIDASQPDKFIDTFFIPQSHALCIVSVPGASVEDYSVNLDFLKDEGAERLSRDLHPENPLEGRYSVVLCQCVKEEVQPAPGNSLEDTATASPRKASAAADMPLPVATLDSIAPSSSLTANSRRVSSVQPCMWIGCQSGHIFIHSSVADHRQCLLSLQLKDSVISLTCANGLMFAGLADGTVAVFARNGQTGEWDISQYACIDLQSWTSQRHSVKALTYEPVQEAMWMANQNSIFIVHSRTLELKHKFDAHPRKDAQIRDLCCVDVGVWVSIRLDSTIRLYHAITYQHLQDVDLTPDVTQLMDFTKLRSTHVSVSCLKSDGDFLWVGTKNGVVACLPFDKKRGREESTRQEGTSTESSESVMNVPYVLVEQCALSVHGHQDAVKFLLTVNGRAVRRPHDTSLSTSEQHHRTLVDNEGNSMSARRGSMPHSGSGSGSGTRGRTSASPAAVSSTPRLHISGGEGYVDFRHTEEYTGPKTSQYEKSHLVVWQS